MSLSHGGTLVHVVRSSTRTTCALGKGRAHAREARIEAGSPIAAGPLSLAAARRLRGSGWEGNLEEMRGSSAP